MTFQICDFFQDETAPQKYFYAQKLHKSLNRNWLLPNRYLHFQVQHNTNVQNKIFFHLYPDQTGAYSWWSYRAGARSRNVGWRIDYFIVSDVLATSVREATIHSKIEGSDHCPVGLSLAQG